MKSKLIITEVEKLQQELVETLKSLKGTGIYVSLNKTKKSMEVILKKNNINTKKIFFIDCVSSNPSEKDVLYIFPAQLDKIEYAIKSFKEEISGEKFLIIDALSTLLIYNSENRVAAFIKEIINYAAEKNTNVIAFSPKTKGEDLLNKIFNFFDVVKGK